MAVDPIKRRDVQKALAKIEERAKKLMAGGMSKKDARSKAYEEARDNPRKSIKKAKKARKR